jgi:hypothetical protein
MILIFFIECTTYRKSFGLEEFIDDLLKNIHPRLRATHTPLIQFSLPKENAIEMFLDELFKPFLNPDFIQGKIVEATNLSPLILSIPEGTDNFYVFLELDSSKNTNLNQPWATAGDADTYIQLAVKEVLNNKRDSNKLKDHHPNLLAVNFLLGVDFQLASVISHGLLPPQDFGSTYDSIFLAACGIDELPEKKYIVQISETFPIRNLLAL